MSASTENVRRLSVVDIAKLHADGVRIATITAYDFPTAALVDEAGIPLILVGDSLAQVVLGYDTTVRVSMDEMLHHTRACRRGRSACSTTASFPRSRGRRVARDCRRRRSARHTCRARPRSSRSIPGDSCSSTIS